MNENNLILLTFIMSLASGLLYSQTNTFPPSGNVGIGITNPIHLLEVNGAIVSRSQIIATNPGNHLASVALGWHNNVSRLRIGGNGTGNRNGFDIQTVADVSLLRVLDNGNIGIGNIFPNYRLHVKGENSWTTRIQNNHGYIDFGPANGLGAHIYTDMDRFLFNKEIQLVGNPSRISAYLNNPFRIGTGGTDRFTILSNGNTGIGTTAPTHRLEVNGTIRAKEVKLEATNWPDYVFGPDYQLMSLKETEDYIKAHGHLPGLKPAAEYETEGVNMMELNQKLLEKIEELTLYLLKQEETIITQRLTLESQDKRLEIIEIKLAEITLGQ